MAQTAAGHAVHQLLLSVRALLDALRQWSEQRMDETQVSDAYVNFGNNFNATITEFRALRIDMDDLLKIPDELRSSLENCLAEDQTPRTLDVYLPPVNKTMKKLLQGLADRQHMYRQVMPQARRWS
ncbi:hypothetical protein EV121DRAFT_285308 [Schizophyllum commune]